MQIFIITIIVPLLSIIIPACPATPLTNKFISTTPNITKPGCPRKCGNLTVPYPFGVGFGVGCSRNEWYDIFCMTSYNPPKAFLITVSDWNGDAVEILDISETYIRLKNQISYRCFNSTAESSPLGSDSILFDISVGAPYRISGAANKLYVVGCNDLARYSGSFENPPYSFTTDDEAKCRSSCKSGAKNVVAGKCNNVGCCQTSISKGMIQYQISHEYESNHTTMSSYNPCGYSFLADQESFKFRGVSDLNDPNFINRTVYDAPLVLVWVISNDTCANAQLDPETYACKENTTCVNADESGIGGYRCTCAPGYKGHPYLSPGCSDFSKIKRNSVKGQQYSTV